MSLKHLHPELRPVVERCVERFRSWTGHAPEAVAWAPGRVNLIGEHTDYNDGFVLPMAINRWCVAAGSTVSGPLGRVRTDDLGQECGYNATIADRAALGRAAWAAYPVGVLWMLRETALRPSVPDKPHEPRKPWSGADVLLASSVPLGSGLSSSASVEVATGMLTQKLFGMDVRPGEIAKAGREAEHRFAGVPCGIMDQMISAEGDIRLIDCRSVESRRIEVSEFDQVSVVVAHSGVKHALGSGEYARRRESCARAAAALGVSALRDATLAMLGHAGESLAAEDRACARHVITENTRVAEFVAALSGGDLAGAGRLLYQSHASLRDDYRVSCAELDALVEAARGCPGVYGSRMTGGGFGGCTVTLCQSSAAASVMEALGRLAPAGAMRPFAAEPVAGAEAAWYAGAPGKSSGGSG